MPLVVGNDGDFGGVGEAQRVRGSRTGSVLMLAPGSGLGCAYIDRTACRWMATRWQDGGRAYAGAAAPAGREALSVRLRPHLGLRRGVHDAVGPALPAGGTAGRLPDHALAHSTREPKQRALALRGLAQKGDPLAVELFDFQARAMGLHIANLAMALDPEFVVIGGGLMDPENTTEAFRERYLQILRDTARPYLWPVQREG